VETIASRQNPVVSRCRGLARGRSDADAALLLEGRHLVEAALDAGLAMELLAGPRDALVGPAAELARRAAAMGARVVAVTAAVLDAMSPVRSPSGLVAIARPLSATPDAVTRPAPALVAVLIDVQDPGNVGAVVRVVDAAGGTGVVTCGTTADPFAWKALRGAMGSAFRMPVVRAGTSADIVARLKGAGLRIVATRPCHGASPYAVDWRRPTAYLLGSEGGGLAPGDLELADEHVTIPMRAGVESLNVSTAAAILAYEAGRQRRGP
jgi:TrmH family RNA methyltransferase